VTWHPASDVTWHPASEDALAVGAMSKSKGAWYKLSKVSALNKVLLRMCATESTFENVCWGQTSKETRRSARNRFQRLANTENNTFWKVSVLAQLVYIYKVRLGH
jgi:hypothetical protein